MLSLARELKSEIVRRRLDERAIAGIRLVADDAGPQVVVDSAEGLSIVQLIGKTVPDRVAASFQRELIASRQLQGARFRYSATLPVEARTGPVQISVATLSGAVASATFGPEGAQ